MNYAEKVLPVMRATREVLLASWGKSEGVSYKGEAAWGIVTLTDIEVEKRVADTLLQLYPDITFEGEERGGSRAGERYWLMDPIDGTAHYARGLPLCTSMLALVDNGRVVFSAIYDFLKDDMYWAERGGGAYCNDSRIHVSGRSIKESYIALESRLDIQSNAELWRRLAARWTVVHTATAGWEFAMLASGKFEGRISFDPYGKDYDFAPGTLLVEEAGGIVANIGASTYDFKNTNLIAATPAVYAALTAGADAEFRVV